MNDFRAVLAMFISVVSGYFVFDLFANGFSWYLLCAALIGFLLVHIIWPPCSSGESAWYEALEFVFDLPYRLIAISIRGLGKVVKNDSVDIGIDL